MKTFLAQKYNSLVAALCKLSLPFFLKRNNLQVKIDQNCLKVLNELRGSNSVILFNHSDRFDPLVVAELSRTAEEDFAYIASREQFDGFNGLQGWLMQRCGAYSVLRGNPEDQQSKEATINFISESDRKLVEFPEGDVTGRDDTVLPLKQDGVRNILEAQQRLIKRGEKDPVYLLPVAIYYEVQKDGIKAMEECLDRLERHLNMHKSNQSIHIRVERIVNALIFNLQEVYAIEAFGDNLDQRLLSICLQKGSAIAKMNGLPLDKSLEFDLSSIKKMFNHSKPQYAAEQTMVFLHSVRNQLWRSLQLDKKNSIRMNVTKYEIKLRREIIKRKVTLLGELDKMEQLLILAHSLQQDVTTLNHAWRVIDRLEQEILGKTSLKGHRIAYLEMGPILNLMQFMPAYRGSEDGAISMVDESVRRKILGALNHLKAEHAVA